MTENLTENPVPNNTVTKARPLGVVHLIFGLVFTGIAAIWLIGEANDTDLPDMAVAFPAVLIGAGIIGLAAVLINQRRAKANLAVTTTAVDDTTILNTELEDES